MPEVPPVPGLAADRTAPPPAALSARVEATFAPAGPLAQTIPGFEARAGQIEMAAAVAQHLEQGGVLLAEAGTGTGKTLAYLIPAILSRQRILVSTGTKNLQEQIYFKDLPALRESLGVPFTATCMKGRANYLCLHRLDQLTEERALGRPDVSLGQAAVFLPLIREWATATETGDRAELQDLPEELPFWSELSATAEACLGTECPRYDDCFITKMRQRAAASDIVIVNHHLLCADAAVRQNAFGEVIPACAHAVVDEAHQLEDVATQYFGLSLSNYRLEELARDIERVFSAGTVDEELARAIDRLRTRAQQFFGSIAEAHRGTDDRVRVTPTTLEPSADAAAHLTSALDIVESTLALLTTRQASDGQAEGISEVSDQIGTLVRRAGTLKDELRQLLRANDAEYAYFVEFRGRGIFLRAAPVDVSAIVRELFFDRMRTVVLTSATLTVDSAFDYIRQRLGITRAAELRLPSEFDYGQQALLYLPRRMPDPRSPDFAMAAGRQVIDILTRTEGRAFVLFTSYRTMRDVQAIAEFALRYPILVQGSAPRTELLRRFRETPHAVLFATSSFWQGVDVVGEQLSCVIIDKLPFVSPRDPIMMARIEAIREAGGDPFGEYQVPLAILALLQGLGRLIRHRTDRGVLAVLDPRLRTMGYGRRFLASLPPAPIVHDLNDIDAFFR